MSIKVAVRVRPFNTREIDRGETVPVVKMVKKTLIKKIKKRINILKRNKKKKIKSIILYLSIGQSNYSNPR